VFTGEIIYNGAGGNAKNTSYGPNALSSNVSGTSVVAIGRAALSSSTTADRGTSVGNYSLGDVTEGSNNTSVGSESGRGITTGSGNSIFGAEVGGLAPNLTNNLILASGGVIRLQHDGVDTLTVNSDIAAPKITASTGVLFGTDTAASNTLDDYEEGTWTPTLDGVADAVYHYFNGGWYTKVGNVVTVGGTFRLSSKGSMSDTLDALIGGLPFTSSDGGGPIGQYRSVASINVNSGFDNGPSGGTIQTRITTNSTSIRLQYFDSGTGNGVYIEGSNVSNGLYMEVSATYSTS
jgi:hypothetical protein